MIDQRLLNFVREHKEYLQNENSKWEMKSALLAQGWSNNMIDEAIFQVVPPMNVPRYQASVLPTPPIPPPPASPPTPPTLVSPPTPPTPSTPATPQPIVQQPTVGQSMVSPATPIFTPQISPVAVLPGPFALLGEAFAIFSRRWPTFLGISLILSLISSIYPTLAMLVVLRTVKRIAETFASGANLQISSSADTLILTVGLVLAGIVIVIGGTASTLALVCAIKDSSEGIGVVESYRRGIRKIFSFWWVNLLMILVVLGGTLLLIIPGIIFAVWFSLAMFVLVAEDAKGLNALLKSREYIKGYWWPVAGRSVAMAFLLIISGGLMLVLNLILGDYWGKIVYNFSVQLVLTPIVLAYTFLVYSHLRAIKGEVAPIISSGKKFGLILLGIIGTLIILASIIALVVLFEFIGSGAGA